MRTLNRDKKDIYICKRILDSEPTQFEAPLLLKLNVVTVSDSSSIVAYGEQHKEFKRAIINNYEDQGFSEGDRAYIDVKPPISDVLCSDADFEIDSILKSVSQTKIMFKRLQHEC